MRWKGPVYWIGIIVGSLVVKVLGEKLALFMECCARSAHTVSECLLIGILY